MATNRPAANSSGRSGCSQGPPDPQQSHALSSQYGDGFHGHGLHGETCDAEMEHVTGPASQSTTSRFQEITNEAQLGGSFRGE